jgi:hypothetical protein
MTGTMFKLGNGQIAVVTKYIGVSYPICERCESNHRRCGHREYSDEMAIYSAYCQLWDDPNLDKLYRLQFKASQIVH